MIRVDESDPVGGKITQILLIAIFVNNFTRCDDIHLVWCSRGKRAFGMNPGRCIWPRCSLVSREYGCWVKGRDFPTQTGGRDAVHRCCRVYWSNSFAPKLKRDGLVALSAGGWKCWGNLDRLKQIFLFIWILIYRNRAEFPVPWRYHSSWCTVHRSVWHRVWSWSVSGSDD